MINKVILIGNLGRDPELRYSQNGSAVVNFSIATTERWKDHEGNKQEHTEWHNIVAWRNLAEFCDKVLKKGSKCYIEGKLQTRKWQDRDGNDKYTTEVVAREMKPLDPKEQTDQYHSGAQQGDATPPPNTGDDVPF